MFARAGTWGKSDFEWFGKEMGLTDGIIGLA